jgi:hypothetical protein
VMNHPLGNGLGGGGTSLPYFLQDRVRDPVVIENEYGRIMAEQGIPGLLIWLAFLLWVFTRPAPRRSDPWFAGRRVARLWCAISFAIAPLGTGLLTAIPGTATLMLFVGWITTAQVSPVRSRAAYKRSFADTPADALQGA